MSSDLIAGRAPIPLLPPFYEDPRHADAAYYLRRIEEEFNLCIERYSYVMDAFDHDVFIVNDEIVFRFPRTGDDQKHLSLEIEFLDKFGPSFGPNTPQYTFMSKNGDFAGYQMIPRYVLSPWEFKKLGEKQKRGVVEQLSSFLGDLHCMNVDTFRPYERRRNGDFAAIEELVQSKLVERLFPRLNAQEIDTIENFYESLRHVFGTVPTTCPTHGDLYAFNVIWDEIAHKVGVIDFSDLVIGDPANDFEVFFDYGDEYAELAYETYVGPKDAQFLERAEAYYRLHAIYTLLSSQLGARITFQHSRMRFRQKFSLDPWPESLAPPSLGCEGR